MARKALSALKVAPLQRVVAEIVTDPAELAAIDKLRKQIKKCRRGGQANNGRSKMSGKGTDKRNR